MDGEKKSVKDAPVKIKLIAPPMYVMTTMTLDKDVGIETLNVAIEAIRVSILGKGYVQLCYAMIVICFSFSFLCLPSYSLHLFPVLSFLSDLYFVSGALDVKMAPKAVTLREETELQAMLDRLALDQEDVDGDDPEDS